MRKAREQDGSPQVLSVRLVEGETVEKKGEEGFRGFRTKVAVVVEDEMTSAWETT